MDVEGAGGETDAATCGSRLGGSHLIFDLTLLHQFLFIFHFIFLSPVHPVISRSATQLEDQDHSSALTNAQPSPRLRLVYRKHGPRMSCLEYLVHTTIYRPALVHLNSSILSLAASEVIWKHGARLIALLVYTQPYASMSSLTCPELSCQLRVRSSQNGSLDSEISDHYGLLLFQVVCARSSSCLVIHRRAAFVRQSFRFRQNAKSNLIPCAAVVSLSCTLNCAENAAAPKTFRSMPLIDCLLHV